MTTGNRIRLTESTDARNARMWQLFRAAATDFDRHRVLIEWQDNIGATNLRAWGEGPKGYAERAGRGVAGYESLIAGIFNATHQ